MATIGKYKIIKSLGTGTFAKVKLAKNTKTGENYAIKIMRKDSDECQGNDDLFLNEIKALSKLNHPNILKLADYADNQTVMTTSNKIVDVNVMALEYAENGEMFKYIADTGSFAEPTARYYFKQLISAIKYINSHGYSHRDIKPENIVLDSEFNLKLADFGFATKKEYSSKSFGTISYMAPEKLTGLPYNTRDCDLFSAAVILFMMVMQRAPFSKAGPDDEYYSYIILGKFDEFWKIHNNYVGDKIHVTDDFKDLFISMVTVAPESRLTLKEIKSHSWTKGYTPNHQEIYENFSYRKMMIDAKFQMSNKEVNDVKGSPETAKKEKNQKKYTKYFKTYNGDHLIDVVTKFAVKNDLKYQKCEEYYRVYLKAIKDSKQSLIQVNVLRIPKEEMRCLECIHMKGSYSLFSSTFSEIKRYVNSHKKEIEDA